MAPNPVLYNATLAAQVLDLVEELANELDGSMPVRFEELTAEPGELPRIMLQLLDSNGEESRYISGEKLCPMPFALTLRLCADDEQTRLDAAATLSRLSSDFLARCVALNGYVAYKRPVCGVPVCLGRTEAFEDWQVEFDLNYKETKGI